MDRTNGNDKSEKRIMHFKTKNLMTVVTWNIKALDKRDQEIKKEMQEHNIDICVVEKTKN